MSVTVSVRVAGTQYSPRLLQAFVDVGLCVDVDGASRVDFKCKLVHNARCRVNKFFEIGWLAAEFVVNDGC
jgi:hypothetical protein